MGREHAPGPIKRDSPGRKTTRHGPGRTIQAGKRQLVEVNRNRFYFLFPLALRLEPFVSIKLF